MWSSIQIANRGADAHRDLTNTPGSYNYTIGVGNYRGGGSWIADEQGAIPAKVQNTTMLGTIYDTKNKVLKFSPKVVHMVEPYIGERYSVSAYTVSDLGKLSREDIQLLSDLGYPIYRDAPRTFGKRSDGIYSIGHSNLDLSTFLERLEECGIREVVDARSDPHSVRFPQYNREELSAICFSRGIIYAHAPELGNRNHGGIEANLQTESGKATLARIASEANDSYHRIAILCSEANWRKCHRHVISNHLWTQFNKTVEHVRGNGMLEPHPIYSYPVIEQESFSTHATKEEPSEAQEISYSPEDAEGSFALTPDGEEHFGAPTDAAMLASLIDYHNAPIETQVGLDAAMATEFNAVVPCTEQEFRELTKAGHVCIPTKC